MTQIFLCFIARISREVPGQVSLMKSLKCCYIILSEISFSPFLRTLALIAQQFLIYVSEEYLFILLTYIAPLLCKHQKIIYYFAGLSIVVCGFSLPFYRYFKNIPCIFPPTLVLVHPVYLFFILCQSTCRTYRDVLLFHLFISLCVLVACYYVILVKLSTVYMSFFSFFH